MSNEKNTEVTAPPAPAPAPPAAEQPAPAQEIEVTLDDFCRDQSRVDRQVELISGFHHEQLAAGRSKATPSDFAAAFAKFRTAPAA